MSQVTLQEAQRQLPELIAAAARGEEVVIAQEGLPSVRLVPLEQAQKPNRKAGSARGKILYMADDFDAPLDDFQEYME